MGFLDRLLGRDRDREQREQAEQLQRQYDAPQAGAPGDRQQTTDQQAIERYRYMLRTAPPEAVEQAHQEAFARLTPEQRQMVLQQLSGQVPPAERASSDDPASLARMATRAEMRQPGVMERTFGGAGGGMRGMGGGMGMGGMLAGSFMSTLAGAFIGTAIAQSFFDNDTGFDQDAAGADSAGAEGGDQAGGDQAGAEGQTFGAEEDYSGDAGADFGGGDAGGGDFGGGDFGGGGEF